MDRDLISRSDLVAVVKAWASPDDWNVPAIYASTVEELAEALAVGADPYVLARHAKHTGPHCCRLYRPIRKERELTLAEAWLTVGGAEDRRALA